jgi:hypothetical protein
MGGGEGLHSIFKKNHFLLSLLIMLMGCNWYNVKYHYNDDNDTGGDRSYIFWGFNYNINNNTILLYNIYPEKNVIQLSKSPDSSWIVYTKVLNDGQIDLFKMHKDNTKPVQITNTAGIEFDPSVDDDGNIAWAYHSYSVSESEIFLNNIKVNLPIGLYKNCFIYDNKLLFSYVRFYDDVHQLISIDIPTNETKTVSVPLVVDNILYFSDSLLLEGYDLLSNNMSIYSYNYQDQSVFKEYDNAVIAGEEIVFLDTISSDRALKLLAERELLFNDPLLSFFRFK